MVTAAKKAASATPVPQRVAPVQSRVSVLLLPRDDRTATALPVEDRGPWPMSPRNFVNGQYLRVGGEYFMIMAVVHDVEDPATITLMISTVKDGLPS